MKLTILFYAAIIGSGLLQAQTHSFDVMLFGKDVGDVTAIRKITGETEIYTIESNTFVNYVLGKRRDIFTGRTEYTDGVLFSAAVQNTKNGKVNYYCNTTKMESGYKIQTEKGLSTITGNLVYSCYKLFFSEPVGITSVYNERFGFSGVLVKKGEHHYTLEMAGEDDYTYYYENGNLVKMEFPSPLGKGYFKRR